MSVASFLRDSALSNPEKTAVYFNNTEIQYKQLNMEADSLARGLLNLGLGFGQMVGLLLGNSPDFIRSYFAVARAGGVILPINPLFKGEEIKFILNDAQVSILITVKAFLPLIESIRNDVPSLKRTIVSGGETNDQAIDLDILLIEGSYPIDVPVQESDTAACLYTSGTTGKPKGALLSHGNLIFDALASSRRFEVDSEDTHLCVLPLFHSFAQMASMLIPISSGGSIAILPQFQPDVVLNEITKRKITCFCGVPAMFRILLLALSGTKSFDLSSLRLCVCGGAPCPPEIIQTYQEKIGITLLEGNGPTETSPVSYVNPPHLCKPGSVGPPLDGVKVKIINESGQELPAGEVGEICIRGPNVMKGYLNQPEATAEVLKEGWLHTGDLGKVDQDGYVYIVDRKKDMIIVGGFNVYPREVEEFLQKHPMVAEAAVIGIPDEKRGEAPKAFVVLKPGQKIAPRELISYCRKNMANFKYPKQVVIVDSLVKNSTGKVDKNFLRQIK
jgi:long-chain acyl-CoA synthetase